MEPNDATPERESVVDGDPEPMVAVEIVITARIKKGDVGHLLGCVVNDYAFSEALDWSVTKRCSIT